VTIYRWVQTFTAEFTEAARPARHATGDRWFVDETYVKVTGRWTYLYRAIAAGHAFVQNLRRGHYELTADVPDHDRLPVAFAALAPSL
jgi:transposase-like protein